MDPEVNRRQFVTSGAAVSSVLAAANGLTAAPVDPPSGVKQRQPVRLDLLTSREVGEWMKTNDVIFVPHGPISGRGPWTTLGVHPHGAEAVADYKGSAGEAIIDYAAMRVIVEPELAKVGLKGGEDQNPEIKEAVNILRNRGTRGFRYDSEREHSSHGTVGLMHQGQPDIELGLKILGALADYLLPAVDALKKHRDYPKSHPAKLVEKQVPLPP